MERAKDASVRTLTINLAGVVFGLILYVTFIILIRIILNNIGRTI